MNQIPAQAPLTDTFGRTHNYLRISLVDNCNFACTYCVPMQKPHKLPQSNLMTAAEIEQLARLFVAHGVDKIRLTGGEPLLRKDFDDIIQQLSVLGVNLTLTTNGYLLHQHIQQLKAAGITSLNISLDTFRADRFQQIARFDGLKQVLANIESLLNEGFHIKINMVLMRGVNDDEIFDFIEFSRKQPVHIRFIEYMPFSGNNWEREKVIGAAELLTTLGERYDLVKLPDAAHDTTRKYKVIGCEGTLAIISTVSEPFCSGCNRLRLTADGKMRNCLFSQGHTDLLTPLRNGEDILPLIAQNVKGKAAQYGGQQMNTQIQNSTMILIGG